MKKDSFTSFLNKTKRETARWPKYKKNSAEYLFEDARQVKADSESEEELPSFNMAEIMLMDPEFKKLKTSISHLLHTLSHKYQLKDEEIIEIAVESLRNPHKTDF